MTDLRELLTDAVADVEPRYALDDIRARTTSSRRRWPYAAGGIVLAVAASVAAFAVLSPDPAPRAIDPGSSTPPPTSSPTGIPTAPDEAVAAYYVGDTPDGPRLYREFRNVPTGAPFAEVVAALELTPLDPDYRTFWPAGSIKSISFDGIGSDDILQVHLADASLHDRPATMNEATARMAVEQVIYTLQASVGARTPVQFALDGNPIDQVLGVPTSEPLAEGAVLATLAHVSITTPTEGMVVDNDEPLVVEGVGNSFEGNIVTWVEDLTGSVVVDQKPTIAGWLEEKLFPYDVSLDLSELPPGDYSVTSSTDDPSGQGREHIDSRSITVVE